MPEIVTTASGSAVQDAESSAENIENIIRREFSGVFDICKIVRFKKNLKENMQKLKNAPSMVQDFCQEVRVIIVEIGEVLEDKNPGDNDSDQDNNGHRENAAADDDSNNVRAQSKEGNENGEKKDKTKNENEDEEEPTTSKQSTAKKEKNKKEKDENGKKPKKEEKKKDDYQKQLKMETVGLADIDRIFTDLATSLNKFVSTREKMQQARESFEKIAKTICNFDGKKELKDYLKELKEKAKEGKMQIYIDTRDGEIKLDSVKGVDPPAPYRNAVKALNDIKASGKETLDLEPVVEHGIESCASDITKIEPVKDFKKLVSGVKETMALPKKIKAFNENRKKVQKAPQIVKELCLYVKQVLQDIMNAFGDEKTEKKNEETKEKEEKDEEEDEEEDKEEDEEEDEDEEKSAKKDKKSEEIVEAAIHAPRKVESNKTAVVC